MKRIVIWIIVFYQKYLSPLKSTKCPYFPSCSQYGLEAVQRYGALKGSLLSAWRILRCNPFSKGGYDPVPSFTNSTKAIVYKNDKSLKRRKWKVFYKV